MKQFYITCAIIFCAFSSIPLTLFGQMDSCNVFLQGNYLEAGINWNGAFGTSSSAPVGYHPKGSMGNMMDCHGVCYTGTANLAFVADPDKDGWGFGSPYAYIGDYCLPGIPQEGWSIMADGIQANAWDGYGCGTSPGISDNHISGGNVSYSASGSERIGAWEADFDSMTVAQIVTLDVNKLYVKVQIVLMNRGSVARKDVYYARSMDPDNTAAESGVYTTINKIEGKLPNAQGRSLVSALGLYITSAPLSNTYLGLGTTDCRGKAFTVRGDYYPETGKLDSIYGKFGGIGDTVHYRMSGSDTADEAIGMVFKIGDLDAGQTTAINFYYIFSKADVDSVLTPAATYWTTAGNANKNHSGDTAVTCANSDIAVNISSAGSYTWNWYSPSGAPLSASTGTTVNVTVASAPAIVIATGSSDCTGNDTIVMVINPALPTIVPTIDITGPFFEKVGTTITLNATVTNTGGPYEILWKNNGVDFATTTSPTVTYTKAPGIDMIKAVVIPLSSGCYKDDTSNLWIVAETVTGVNTVNKNAGIKVYPNPFSDVVEVDGLMHDDMITVYDADGRIVRQLKNLSGQSKQALKLDNVAPGNYLLKVTDINKNMRVSTTLQKIK
ncbi:MAG: T9SS type A sorting domain-containing protein [Flavipsychrobacter sp.]